MKWYPASQDVINTEGGDKFDVDVIETQDGEIVWVFIYLMYIEHLSLQEHYSGKLVLDNLS